MIVDHTRICFKSTKATKRNIVKLERFFGEKQPIKKELKSKKL